MIDAEAVRGRETVSVSFEEEDGAILHRRKNDDRIWIRKREKERGNRGRKEETEGKSASPNTNRFELSSQLASVLPCLYIAFVRSTEIF